LQNQYYAKKIRISIMSQNKQVRISVRNAPSEIRSEAITEASQILFEKAFWRDNKSDTKKDIATGMLITGFYGAVIGNMTDGLRGAFFGATVGLLIPPLRAVVAKINAYRYTRGANSDQTQIEYPENRPEHYKIITPDI